MNGNETSGGLIGDIVKVIAQKYQWAKRDSLNAIARRPCQADA
jgi:hypothetical protein